MSIRHFIDIVESTKPTASFDSWSGKAVDDSGHPLVVYHGTNQTFDTFSKRRGGMATGPQAGARHGFFFTSDPEEAKEYALNAGSKVVSNISAFEKQSTRLRKESERLERIAQKTGQRADWAAYEQAHAAWEEYEISSTQEEATANVRVITAHLSLQNPLEVDFGGGRHSEFGVIEDVVEKALRDGNDGVIMRNIYDSPVGGRVSDHYVVFSAKQIRRLASDPIT